MNKWSSHLSVGDLFHKMTEWKVVSTEIPLHFILCLGSQFIPRNILTSFSSLLRVPFYSGRGAGRKLNWGIPAWLCLEFSRGHQLRGNKTKKANIANSANFSISKCLKIVWNYCAENHSYNKVEMIPSGKTGQLYHYCCWAESSERPLHHQLSNYKDSNCTPCNNYP